MTEQEALKWWREQDREAMDDVFLPPFIAIMDAYAAEHPADDGEPVTAEWLKENGWTVRELPPDDVPYWEYIDENGVVLLGIEQTDTNVWEEIHFGWPYDIYARCQVRGLLRELTR